MEIRLFFGGVSGLLDTPILSFHLKSIYQSKIFYIFVRF